MNSNQKALLATGLLVVSELLPFVPIPGGGLIHTTLLTLNKLHYISDDKFKK
jgi:hypothetical protein